MEQKRVFNMELAHKSNRAFLRKQRVRDYEPGQAIYNLGDYPEKISAQPTDYDRALIRSLKEGGVKIIQLHEEWNDPIRAHGADKFSAVDPEGMRAFIDLCHENGIKVLAYASSGFFQKTDPDYRDEFSKSKTDLTSHFFSYRKCTHSNPDWREFILKKHFEILDNYDFDGLFNDIGYDRADKVENEWYDPHVEDVLFRIYTELKKRGKIYKVHCDCNNPPPCKDKCYDYVWVGECVDHFTAGIGKDWENTYVVPCIDRRYIDATIDVYMAYTLPFMQFPLLKTGRYIMGKNGNVEGVTYYGGGEEEFYRAVEKYMEEHPDGPYVYSLWSPIPDDPDEFNKWKYYFKLYEPMVKEDTLCYMELRETDEIASEIDEEMYISMFVNDEIYLIASNLTGSDKALKLKSEYTDMESGESASEFILKHEQVRFFKRNHTEG